MSTFSAGAANITGDSFFDDLTISGATANFNGTNQAIIENALVSGGSLGGTNAVYAEATFIWSGGNISGQGLVAAGSGVTISNGSGNLNLTGRILANALDGVWTGNPGGSITISGGGVLSNYANSTLDAEFDGSLANSTGANLFANSGLFRKTGRTGSTTIGVPIANTGTMEVQTGTLSLTGGGTSTGTFNVSSNAALNIGGGSADFTTNSVINIPEGGILTVTGGTPTFEGTIEADGAAFFIGGTANVTGSSGHRECVSYGRHCEL